jgi:hypothetical protein
VKKRNRGSGGGYPWHGEPERGHCAGTDRVCERVEEHVVLRQWVARWPEKDTVAVAANKG